MSLYGFNIRYNIGWPDPIDGDFGSISDSSIGHGTSTSQLEIANSRKKKSPSRGRNTKLH
jgi:hypothetical protein